MSHENPEDYIERAAELIALDNGAINRNSTRDDVVRRMTDAVKRTHIIEDRANAEEFLSKLTATELEDLCSNEEGTVEAPTEVEAILSTMFDNLL